MINSTLLIGTPGVTEIIIIAVILLLLFGGKKIPELMKGLGKGMNEFKKAKSDMEKEEEEPEKKEKK